VEGRLAFVPDPLPRSVPLPPAVVSQLDKASLAVGTLAGVGETLAHPHLLIMPFLRREAVLSSRIEGTQASISDVFIYEVSGERGGTADTKEVVNYVHALNYGLELVQKLPICTRLTNEVHARLMEGVRGEEKAPGRLREFQNWIGSGGTLIGDARYIPPPPELVPELMSDWEKFANGTEEMPPLVRCALMHYQFEAIHPYLDGNGRIGRLLIILFLCQKQVLPTPLLYLSAYFEKNRDEYIEQLYRVSVTGQWESWILFFLRGVEEQARDALARSRRVRQLHEKYRDVLQTKKESANAFRLLDSLFENPYTTAPLTTQTLGVSPWGAQGILRRLEAAGILTRMSGMWPRIYAVKDLLEEMETPAKVGRR
jgi:Fic family protein